MCVLESNFILSFSHCQILQNLGVVSILKVDVANAPVCFLVSPLTSPLCTSTLFCCISKFKQNHYANHTKGSKSCFKLHLFLITLTPSVRLNIKCEWEEIHGFQIFKFKITI